MAGVGQVGGLMSWEELEKLWEMEKLPEMEELSQLIEDAGSRGS